MRNYKLMENPKTIFCGILIVGIVLLFYSLTIPKYIDENKYQALIDMFYQGTIAKENYYSEIAKISTNKTFIMDLSNGIITFSLFGLLFLFISKISNWKSFSNIRTLDKLNLFFMSIIAWLLLIPSTLLYYYYRGGKGDYPPFADSIGIPIMQQTIFVLIMLIPLTLFLFVSLYKSKLPTKLFMRLSNYKRVSILWEIFFDVFLLLNMICLTLFIVDGDHISITISMFFLYLLLSLRAGKLNYLEQI